MSWRDETRRERTQTFLMSQWITSLLNANFICFHRELLSCFIKRRNVFFVCVSHSFPSSPSTRAKTQKDGTTSATPEGLVCCFHRREQILRIFICSFCKQKTTRKGGWIKTKSESISAKATRTPRDELPEQIFSWICNQTNRRSPRSGAEQNFYLCRHGRYISFGSRNIKLS